MRNNVRGISPIALGALGAAAILSLAVTACSKTITVTGPEEPPPPGYVGEWSASFQGSELTLTIQPFDGERTTTASLRWNTIDWPAECRIFDIPDQEDPGLTCTISPEPGVAFCGDPDPFIDITNAVPRIRLEVEVGGQIREGSGSPCDGPIIESLEPGENLILLPGLS